MFPIVLADWVGSRGVHPRGDHGEGVSARIACGGACAGRGWGLLLLPVAMAAAVMAGGAHGLIPAELGLAVLAIVFAPKLAAKLVPYGVLGLAVFGVHLAKLYRDGFTSQVQYLFIHAGPDTWDGGAAPVLAEAGVLFVVGLWLLLRLDAPGAGLVRALAARWLDRGRGGISAVHGLLLIPVVGLAMQLLGPDNWFGPGGRRARRGPLRPDRGHGRAGADLPVAGLGRDAGRGGPAGPRRLRLADRGVLARCPGSRTASPTCTTTRRPPRSGPTPCKAPSCWPWACGWRRG